MNTVDYKTDVRWDGSETNEVSIIFHAPASSCTKSVHSSLGCISVTSSSSLTVQPIGEWNCSGVQVDLLTPVTPTARVSRGRGITAISVDLFRDKIAPLLAASDLVRLAVSHRFLYQTCGNVQAVWFPFYTQLRSSAKRWEKSARNDLSGAAERDDEEQWEQFYVRGLAESNRLATTDAFRAFTLLVKTLRVNSVLHVSWNRFDTWMVAVLLAWIAEVGGVLALWRLVWKTAFFWPVLTMALWPLIVCWYLDSLASRHDWTSCWLNFTRPRIPLGIAFYWNDRAYLWLRLAGTRRCLEALYVEDDYMTCGDGVKYLHWRYALGVSLPRLLALLGCGVAMLLVEPGLLGPITVATMVIAITGTCGSLLCLLADSTVVLLPKPGAVPWLIEEREDDDEDSYSSASRSRLVAAFLERWPIHVYVAAGGVARVWGLVMLSMGVDQRYRLLVMVCAVIAHVLLSVCTDCSWCVASSWWCRPPFLCFSNFVFPRLPPVSQRCNNNGSVFLSLAATGVGMALLGWTQLASIAALSVQVVCVVLQWCLSKTVQTRSEQQEVTLRQLQPTRASSYY